MENPIGPGHLRIEDFARSMEEATSKLDAILQGQKDAKTRMGDLVAALKNKNDWDESVLALMNAMAEQILAVAGESTEAIALADAVREKVQLVEKLLAEKTYRALLSRSDKEKGRDADD